jgi:hypothetical protein
VHSRVSGLWGSRMRALTERQRIRLQAWNGGVQAARDAVVGLLQGIEETDPWWDLVQAILEAIDEQLLPDDRLTLKTNAELARKWRCSKRTIQYWKAQGCPLDGNGRYVLDWLAGQRSVPAGTRSRFACQLARRGRVRLLRLVTR